MRLSKKKNQSQGDSFTNYWSNFVTHCTHLSTLLLPEHKLFVGMLPKNVTDAEMTDLFSQYGNIKDLQILRGSQQTSKGKTKIVEILFFMTRNRYYFFSRLVCPFNCLPIVDVAAGCAFLKYETKEQAVAAIEALNGKHKIEVCEKLSILNNSNSL